MIDYIIGGILLAVFALVIIRMVRRSKKGGGCAGCSACAGKTYSNGCTSCCNNVIAEKTN